MTHKITIESATDDITEEQAFSFLVRVRMLGHHPSKRGDAYVLARSASGQPRWMVSCDKCRRVLYDRCIVISTYREEPCRGEG